MSAATYLCLIVEAFMSSSYPIWAYKRAETVMDQFICRLLRKLCHFLMELNYFQKKMEIKLLLDNFEKC